MQSETRATLQALIDKAVEEGAAPGLQYAVFDREGILFNGASGYASLPSEENPSGKLMTESTLLWIASCTKILASMLTLHVLDKGLIEGISLADLDNPDALAKVIPEFAPESGCWMSKVTEGFEGHLGPDGKRILKLRDAKNRVTLRHLLTHTSGLGLQACDPLIWEMNAPSDGSVPLIGPMFQGPLRDCIMPLLFEPGTNYKYSCSTEWLAQFVIRGTRKNLRQLFNEIIFNPLQIPTSEADLWLSPELISRKADYYLRDDKSPFGFKKFPFEVYSAENIEEGMIYSAQGGLYSTAMAFARVLQAVVNKDPKIMSPAAWELAFKDDFGPRGLTMPRPDLEGQMELINNVDVFSKTVSENGTGMNLLQCKVALVPTLSGRPAGSFAWAGMANSYYFVDPTTGFGGFISAQTFPFFDPRVVEVRDQFESLIYKTLVNL